MPLFDEVWTQYNIDDLSECILVVEVFQMMKNTWASQLLEHFSFEMYACLQYGFQNVIT